MASLEELIKVIISTTILLVAGLACRDTLAEDDWFGGFVLLDAAKVGVRTENLNPNNFFEIPSANGNATLLLEGVQSGFNLRGRIEQHKDLDLGRNTNFNAILLEFNRVFSLDENSSLSIGKRLFSLDQSYIGQPLGFFQKQADLNDPTDSAGRAEGLPMIVYSWSDEKRSFNAIYSNDFTSKKDGFNRGIEQWLLRAGYEFTGASASVIIRRANGESIGLGATFSATLSDTTSIYGTFYSAKGTLRPALVALENGLPFFSNSRTGALASLRAGDDTNYLRSSVGAIYAPQNLPKIQFELNYDRRGFSHAEYLQYLKLIAFHQQGVELKIPSGLIDSNLSYDSQVLLSRGSRRNYASLSAEQSFGRLTLNCGTYVGLDDRSGIYYLSVGYPFTRNIIASLSTTSFLGSKDSERRLNVISGITTARLKWLF